MNKNFSITLVILSALIISGPLNAASETPLEPGGSYQHSVQPGETQAYSFSVNDKDGYCVKVDPSQGNPDVFVYDYNFRLVGKSVERQRRVDKVYVAAPPVGSYHVLVVGSANEQSEYEISLIVSPFISRISAWAGLNGSILKIWGKGFRKSGLVKLGDSQVDNFITWKNTYIELEIPADVPSGLQPVRVKVKNIDSNAIDFTVGLSSDGLSRGYDLGRKAEFPDGPLTVPVYLRWTKYLGKDVEPTSPVVINDTVYLIYDGQLRALSANTGNIKWRSPVQLKNINVAIANNVIYAFTDKAPIKLCAFDTQNGEIIWQKEIVLSDGRLPNEVYSEVVVHDNKIYFLVQADDNTVSFLAYDATTTDELWHYDNSEPTDKIASALGPAIENNIVYFLVNEGFAEDGNEDNNHFICALDVDKGELKWKKNYIDHEFKVFCIANGKLYFSASEASPRGTRIICLSASDGEQEWSRLTSSHYYSIAFSNDIVYLCGQGGYNNQDVPPITALNPEGDVIWEQPGSPTYSTISISNGFCYMDEVKDNEERWLVVADANTGEFKYKYKMAAHTIEPSICGGKIYRIGPWIYQGKIYIVGSRTIGESEWYYLYCFGETR